MFLVLIYWKLQAAWSQSAFPPTDTKQEGGSVCKRHCGLCRLRKLFADMSCAGTADQGTYLSGSIVTQSLTLDYIPWNRSRLKACHLPHSPSIHVSFLSHLSTSQSYVWFSLLFSRCSLLPIPFLSLIFSVFLSAAPAYLLYPDLSPCLAPVTTSRSLSPLIAFTFIPLCLPAH